MTAPPPILLDRLAHVCYQHPDLNEAKRFLLDFGLLVEKEEPDRIFFRGYGPEPVIYIATKGKRAFLGGTWVVQSMAELEKTVSYHNAPRIQDMDAPGGGKYVTLRDPNDMVVRLVFGQTLRSAETYGAVIMNASSTKPRKGEFVRLKPGPSEVYKLGHYGFSVHLPHFMKVRNWYTTTFNLKVTDSVFDTSTNEDITSFLHIDKGAEFVDHHVSPERPQIPRCLAWLCVTNCLRAYSSSPIQRTSPVISTILALNATISIRSNSATTGWRKTAGRTAGGWAVTY